MNTTSADQPTSSLQPGQPDQPRRLRMRLRRLLSVVVALVAIALPASLVTAPAASAAPAPAYVTVCFYKDYDWRQVGQGWDGMVYYRIYNPSTQTWHTLQQQASANGCTRWAVHAGYYTFFQAYQNWDSFYYDGTSPVQMYAAGGQYNLGWFKVIKRGTTWW